MQTKVTLKFNLPEDSSEFENICTGIESRKALNAIVDKMSAMLRDRNQYNTAEDALDAVWNMIWEVIEEKELTEVIDSEKS